VAPARLARLPRFGAAREPQAARRRLRRDARFCAEALGARSSSWTASGLSEAGLREQRRSARPRPAARRRPHRLGQVETILYRLVSRGRRPASRRERRRRRHPLLPLWREETEDVLPRGRTGVPRRRSNADTKRGLIRDEILPLLRRLHPAADENLLRALDTRETLPPALAELLAAPVGSKRVDLGGGLQAVREHERLWLERGPMELAGEIRWGDWTIRSELEGLRVRGWRPGDRLAGRRRKIQDVFVDAKVPRSDREAWPLVVRGDEVVAVPGIVEHPEVEAVRD
jgi:tRNA(Ile)-lysidine synthase